MGVKNSQRVVEDYSCERIVTFLIHCSVLAPDTRSLAKINEHIGCRLAPYRGDPCWTFYAHRAIENRMYSRIGSVTLLRGSVYFSSRTVTKS